jgi:hypothetical protein
MGQLRDTLNGIGPAPRDLDGGIPANDLGPASRGRQLPYAPPAPVDPIQLASMTIKAVHQVGINAAAEVREIAYQIVAASQELAAKLNELADAIQGHSNETGVHVEEFCDRLSKALQRMRDMSDEFHDTTPSAQPPAPTPMPDLESTPHY